MVGIRKFPLVRNGNVQNTKRKFIKAWNTKEIFCVTNNRNIQSNKVHHELNVDVIKKIILFQRRDGNYCIWNYIYRHIYYVYFSVILLQSLHLIITVRIKIAVHLLHMNIMNTMNFNLIRVFDTVEYTNTP